MNIRPDWNEVSERLGQNFKADELHSAWTIECNKWLGDLVSHFGSDYRIVETQNFSLVSNESDRYIKVFSDFLERTLSRILKTLPGIANDEGYGKHVAIIFKDMDQYYDYVSLFYLEEGEFGLSSGMYINEGYGHFAFPHEDINLAEPIAVHELTHACLAHLPIPTWLNEGLAVFMEEVLAGIGLEMNNEVMTDHQRFWNPANIQNYWTGESFHMADEGQGLSYHLSHLLTRNISKDYDAFARFVNDAHYMDAGAGSCINNLGVSLSQLVGVALGDGQWEPSQDALNKGLNLTPGGAN